MFLVMLFNGFGVQNLHKKGRSERICEHKFNTVRNGRV